jgi:uncharacterized protein (TIGR00288 family)
MSQIAVFIDFENIATAAEKEHRELDLSLLIEQLKTRGTIAIKRAYGDWGRWNKYRFDLLENAIELIHLYSYGYSTTGKNRADIRLAIDAIEAVFAHPSIEIYAVMSGDSDFSSLINKLKEYGKYTIGIGLRKSTSDLLVNACDEFLFYETLVGVPEVAGQFDKEDARQLLIKAMKALEGEEQPIHGSKLKQTMIALDPSFNEANYGYEQFRDFVEDNKDVVGIQFRNKVLYVTTAAPEEAAHEARPAEVLPLAERYKRFLRRVGMGVIEASTRREIIEDLHDLLSLNKDEITLNLAAQRLRERYELDNLPRSKYIVLETMRLMLHAGCLSFPGGPASLATPVRLGEGESPDRLIRRAERAYVHKLIEGQFPVDPDQLSVALFGNTDRAPYMEELVAELVAEGQVQVSPERSLDPSLGYHALSRDVRHLLADSIFDQPRADLETTQLAPDTPVSSSAAEAVFQEGTKLRTTDFAAAASCYLRAMKLQQLALDAGEQGAAVDDFKWYLASYCSVKAGLSFVTRDYEAAIPYYLAFFALVREGDLVYDKVKGLINPMLAYYFAIASRRMGVVFHRNTDAPKVAVMLCNHPNPVVQDAWQHLTRQLGRVNSPLLLNLVDQVPTVTGSPQEHIQRTVAVLRERTTNDERRTTNDGERRTTNDEGRRSSVVGRWSLVVGR